MLKLNQTIMTKEEKVELLKRVYKNGGQKSKGAVTGYTHAHKYYAKHKSGRRQLGYTIGNLLGNIDILTYHTISKIKK